MLADTRAIYSVLIIGGTLPPIGHEQFVKMIWNPTTNEPIEQCRKNPHVNFLYPQKQTRKDKEDTFMNEFSAKCGASLTELSNNGGLRKFESLCDKHTDLIAKAFQTKTASISNLLDTKLALQALGFKNPEKVHVSLCNAMATQVSDHWQEYRNDMTPMQEHHHRHRFHGPFHFLHFKKRFHKHLDHNRVASSLMSAVKKADQLNNGVLELTVPASVEVSSKPATPIASELPFFEQPVQLKAADLSFLSGSKVKTIGSVMPYTEQSAESSVSVGHMNSEEADELDEDDFSSGPDYSSGAETPDEFSSVAGSSFQQGKISSSGDAVDFLNSPGLLNESSSQPKVKTNLLVIDSAGNTLELSEPPKKTTAPLSIGIDRIAEAASAGQTLPAFDISCSSMKGGKHKKDKKQKKAKESKPEAVKAHLFGASEPITSSIDRIGTQAAPPPSASTLPAGRTPAASVVNIESKIAQQARESISISYKMLFDFLKTDEGKGLSPKSLVFMASSDAKMKSLPEVAVSNMLARPNTSSKFVKNSLFIHSGSNDPHANEAPHLLNPEQKLTIANGVMTISQSELKDSKASFCGMLQQGDRQIFIWSHNNVLTPKK